MRMIPTFKEFTADTFFLQLDVYAFVESTTSTKRDKANWFRFAGTYSLVQSYYMHTTQLQLLNTQMVLFESLFEEYSYTEDFVIYSPPPTCVWCVVLDK